jgi:hypothetical protein
LTPAENPFHLIRIVVAAVLLYASVAAALVAVTGVETLVARGHFAAAAEAYAEIVREQKAERSRRCAAPRCWPARWTSPGRPS